MVRPLKIAGIVVIALLASILQPLVSAQPKLIYAGSYAEPPFLSNFSSARGIDSSIPVRFLEQLIAIAPPWLQGRGKATYYALANLAGLITTVVEGKWIGILAALITIWIIPATIYRFFQSVFSSTFRKGLLEGTWYAYHFTRMYGKLILRQEQWKIKRNLQNRLIIETSDPKNSNLKYKGTVSEGRDFIYILLYGIKHEEKVQMQFPNIIPTGQDMAVGLAMGVDFDHKQQCLVRIMSRKKLLNEEAQKILQSNTTMRDDILCVSEACEKAIDFNQTVPTDRKNEGNAFDALGRTSEAN
jgi:hypothetical protein